MGRDDAGLFENDTAVIHRTESLDRVNSVLLVMAKGAKGDIDRVQELCSDLNLDSHTKEEALKEYSRIRENYTLEVVFPWIFVRR